MGEPDRGRIQPLRPLQLGFGALFDAVPDAVVIAEAGVGLIHFWNPAAEKLFGYTASEALGLPIEDLMPERMKELHRAGLGRYNRTGHGGYIDAHTAIELPAVRKDGEELTIELTLGGLEALPVTGRFVIAIIRDMTERDRREEELRQRLVRLQGELLERHPQTAE